MSRKGKQYKAYLDASVSGDRFSLIPKSTLRRWRLQGKLNEDRLNELGLSSGKRRCPSGSSQQKLQNPNIRASSSESTLKDVEQEGCSSEAVSPSIGPVIGSEMDVRGNLSEVEDINMPSESDESSESSMDSTLSDISFSDDEITESPSKCSIWKSKFISMDALNSPLHPSLNISKFETLLMILHISMRHKMTDVFIEDLLHLINHIVWSTDALPSSKHLFRKLFMFGCKPTIHFYCPNCVEYLGFEGSFPKGVVDCENCDWSSSVSSHNDGNYFLTLNMRKQIQDVLCKPGIKFVSTQRPGNNVISDIVDGREYMSSQKDGKFLSDRNALTITFNTDGAPVFKSGPNSLWPIHFYINEIEVSQRFHADNILLGELWFGKSEAKLQIILKLFINELKELEKEGVIWKRPDGTIIESPVYVICCCTDSVAKPKVQCHLQFNGSFACGYRLHPNHSITILEKVNSQSGVIVRASGENYDSVENGSEVFRRKKLMRYTRGEYQLRTNKELREHMKLAAGSPFDHVTGSTGQSVLCDLKYFDVVFRFAIDYMHAVLLGTVKRLVGYWLDSTNKNLPYYIGQAIDRLDLRLLSITLPSGFRPPRLLSEYIGKPMSGDLFSCTMDCLL